jgi:predicted PhzF superfamily epimerase YddE/YHI9
MKKIYVFKKLKHRPSELRIKAELKDDNFDINIGGKVIEIAEGDWKTKHAS